MAEIVTPSGLVNELTVITDGDTISEVNVPSEAFNRKIKKSADKTYFQKDLKDGTEQLNPRSFTSGRFDSQELVSGAISVTGWYTIAETEAIFLKAATAYFTVSGGIGSLSCVATHIGNASAKTHVNTIIKLTDFANVLGVTSRPNSFRIAKSDSVSGAGAKLQVLLDTTSSYSITVMKTRSTSESGSAGWQLVTPFLDNTPTLPDGVTVGTFLEAGEEFSFSTASTYMFPNMIAHKTSNDNIRVMCNFEDIPKQGSTITLTLPATSLQVIDGAAAVGSITVAHTTGAPSFLGKHVYFDLIETGAFASVNTGPLFFKFSGAGGKLTIT